MSALSESSSPKGGLYCELCDDIQFLTYTDWQIHHLHHLRQPFVQLVKLNRKLCQRLLEGRSYKVNSGVARSLQHHVPPLKIFIKCGSREFSVKKEEDSSNCGSPKPAEPASESESKGSGDEIEARPMHEGPSEVEGKDLLERLGANFSISRKVGKKPEPVGKKPEPTEPAQNATPSTLDGKKENILQRLSGIEGISISSVSKSANVEAKPSCGVSISTKKKSLELSELKLLKDKLFENEKKPGGKNKILEKLAGSGLLPKTGTREEEKDCRGENKIRVRDEETLRGEVAESPEGARSKSNKSDDSNDSTDSKVSGEGRTGQVNANEENGKAANEGTGGEQKKFVRVKRSSFKKSMRPRRRDSNEDAAEERTGTAEDGKEKDSATGETGIVILERLTENLNNTVGAEKSAETAHSSQSNSLSVGDPLAINAGIGELNSDLHGTANSECPQATESRFQDTGEKNLREHDQVDVLLASQMNEQNGKNSSYSAISQNQPEPYGESLNVPDGNGEANEGSVSFTSLPSDNQSEDQGEQQTAFWTDIQNSSNNDNQPQEDPLLTPDNPVPEGDSNFLQSFSTEYQPPPGNLPPENSEFMSLDRLGHTQHRQSPYGNDPTSPMEHLNQQVQRLPNPTPQINVISPHHLQAPQPPQLHSGVAPPPPQPNPQQLLLAGNDALHMQPPLPPPLYQGYMYNQSYPPQPQMPRAPQPQMPMLQQRPTMPRGFQTVPVPQQRPGPRASAKRKMMRPPQEMHSSSKQPRMTSPSQSKLSPSLGGASPSQMRTQVPNVAAKSPSGTTVSHPKALEASKVANVLASRGITVTPSRQTNQTRRPQAPQQRPQTSPSSTVRGAGPAVGPAVSVASSSPRNSGGFAVPSPRRSAPIVNHNAERPERCMTVDLTQDEEPPSLSRNRQTAGRFPCQMCGKVFGSSTALGVHKNYHMNIPAFKCDLCSMQFNTMSHLMNHRQTCHKKTSAPDLAIPIVDLNHPGARDQLRKCGVFNFIPLAQLQSNNNGYFGVPIIQLDTAKEKAVSNLSLLGAGNILVLGKMKAITPQGGGR